MTRLFQALTTPISRWQHRTARAVTVPEERDCPRLRCDAPSLRPAHYTADGWLLAGTSKARM